MVLDDSTTTAGDGENTQSQPGPTYPYGLNLEQLRADFNRFEYSRYVHPLPILGPLFGFGESRVRRMVAAEWGWARKTLKRPLRSEEEDALAGAACLQMRRMSYAGPTGVAMGLYRAYSTRHTWRLPFWSMRKDFDPAVVRVSRGRQILQGESAKMFWTVLRNSLYSANGVAFMMLFFLSFSTSSLSVAIQRDPRLADFREALKTEIQEQRQRGGLPRRPSSPMPQSTQSDPTGQGPRSAGELWRNHRTDIGERHDGYDEASPTGEQGVQDSYMKEENFSFQGSGGFDASKPARPSLPPKATRPYSREQPSDAGIMDDFDDASPIAPAAPSSQQQSFPKQQGNSWERLRRQAAENDENSMPGSRPEREPRAPHQENFSFSNSEENRELARGEAQKDFDARIERERHGGDFDEGREGRKRW